MRIIKTNTYEEMSVLAANMIGGQVLLKPNCVLGLATGSSPIGTYKTLVENYEKGILDFSRVQTVNLDEYCGLSGDNPNSYRYFMNHHLFDHINIDKANTHVPNGNAVDLEAEAIRYEKFIESIGGVDLQLLGIGHNGHIGFNEPTTYFPKDVHTVNLTESTINANSRLFERREDVPTQAITMGIGTIMKANKILLIAGEDKTDIIEKSLYGKVTPEVPASVLQLHKDVTVIICKKK
ncbi:glucosamine-6-phosphate deaminase [Anaeromassilibacillus senegalensis]|uniref:Glucosamine-6-phosphate deaminase n=1 Tax=Anaeromassilibacillus senegalensis TaxID=1673717 RepID=A0ABS9CMS8_9FIRM|nr:glucosamine-6-phosphate deaminase [Anaeromassilibacillus senegalensis]MCF2652461.1 glucosamine-6-phosphate deaminase [Anaeromassilibacillus senegalensis]MCI5652211.1 glucosamine-6-phosphate deaminase [Ruminococcus bromii]MDD7647356.1 glucosamine-6-phosphate deaminase [Ruminococcus bromii]